jgi:hypothetical protein
MNRVAIGVIVGFLFMLIAPFIFTEWEVNALMNVSLGSIFLQMGSDPARAFCTWFGLGFQNDGSFFRIFTDLNWLFNTNLREIMWMTIMAWFSTAFVIGLIVRGPKKSTFTALGVFISYFALYMILAVISGKDLATIFTGPNFVDQIGVLLTGALFSALGGVLGGKISGAGED